MSQLFPNRLERVVRNAILGNKIIRIRLDIAAKMILAHKVGLLKATIFGLCVNGLHDSVVIDVVSRMLEEGAQVKGN